MLIPRLARAAPQYARAYSRARRGSRRCAAPSAGTASMRGALVLPRTGRQQRGNRAGRRVATSRQRWRARSCGCAHTVVHVVDLRVGDLRVLEALDHLFGGQVGEGVDDEARAASSRAALRCELLAKRVVGWRARAGAAPWRRTAAHSRSFCRPSITVLAVAGGERAVRIDRGVAGAGARRRRRAVERVVQRIAHPLDERFEHRDVEVLAAAGLLPLQQRRQDARYRRTCRRRCRRSTARPCWASSSVPVIDTKPASLWISRS